MELDYLYTFREVARRQSFTRAAEALGYAQSSVTAQIQKLEKEYGVPLIERYGRSLRLTPPGEELLVTANRMLELFEQSKEKVGVHTNGSMLIGTMDSLAAYYLPPYLRELKGKYPNLMIGMQPDTEEELVAKVKAGDLDIAVTLDRAPADPFLRCIPVRREPIVVIVSPEHPLARDGEAIAERLSEMDWVVSEESCLYRTLFEQRLKEAGVPFRVGFELGSLEAIKQCVRYGLGIGLLPRIAVEEELRQGTLATLESGELAAGIELQLLVHPNKWMNQPLLTLIRLLAGDDAYSVSMARGSTKP